MSAEVEIGRCARFKTRHYAFVQGLSMSALAERAGMSRTTLARRLENPDSFYLSELERLAGVFGVPFMEFLGIRKPA